MEIDIADPTFGHLAAAPGYWRGRIEVPGYAVPVQLFVEEGQRPPSEAQRTLFLEFMKGADSLRPRLQERVHGYYESVKTIYRSPHLRSPEEADEEVPDLAGSSEIWRLLSDPAIMVPDQGRCPEILVCSWNCSWDIERGVAVVLKKLVPVKAGIDNSSILDEYSVI